jgi:hypothetical protein
MKNDMSDQQDSEHFTYDKSWGEIEQMLFEAELQMNKHNTDALAAVKNKDRIFHVRNYTALRGVVKTLRWVLGDMKVKDPLE